MISAQTGNSNRFCRVKGEGRGGSSVRLARRGRRARPDRHHVAAAVLALIGLDQRADAARRGAAALVVGFDTRVAAHGVDHDALAVDDVLALADHDIAGQRDGLGNQVVDAEIAAGVLILGDDGDAAARFDAPDILCAFGSCRRRGRFGVRFGVGRCVLRAAGLLLRDADLLAVEHDQLLAFHRGIALHHLNVAGEGRLLLLVAHFQRRRFDLDRLVLVLAALEQALYRRARSRPRRLRHGQYWRQQSESHGTEGQPARHWVFALSASWSGCSTIETPPSKWMTSPFSVMAMRLALRKPLSNFTATGLSETTLPLCMSTTASWRRAA